MRIKKYSKAMKIFLSVSLACLMLFSTVFAAGPIDLDKNATLTLSYNYKDTPIRGAKFRLYRVADVNAYAYSNFTLAGDFADSGVSLDNLDSKGWTELAATLSGFVGVEGISPFDEGETDHFGNLSFPAKSGVSLKAGLYLVLGDKEKQGDYTYTAEPFLVMLPQNSDVGDSWDYDISASPKVSRKTSGGGSSGGGGGTGGIGGGSTLNRKVIKVWDDENYEHNRPEEITVVLLRDGVPYESVVLNEENSWTHLWKNLSGGYSWTLAEKSVPAKYNVRVKQEGITFVVTNTYVPDNNKVTHKIVKTWKDAGFESNRPSQITVDVLCDGEVFATVTLNEQNGWKVDMYGLDETREWSIREKDTPEGYKATISKAGNVHLLTNTYSKVDKDSPDIGQVIIQWNDKGNEDKRPDDIKVELNKDGNTHDVVVLDPENDWYYKWNDLDPDGDFSIDEIPLPDGYVSEIIKDGNNFVITNTYVPDGTEGKPEKEDKEVHAIKIWHDKGHEDKRPEYVEVELLRDGEVVDTVILSDENEWKHSWGILDSKYDWVVREKNPPAKYVSSSAVDGNTYIFISKYSELPQTGQLWWPVPILVASGLLFIIIGLFRRKGAKNED